MLTSHLYLGVKWWEDVFTAPDFRRPCWAGMDEPHPTRDPVDLCMPKTDGLSRPSRGLRPQ